MIASTANSARLRRGRWLVSAVMSMVYNEDTIAAIATPLGEGAVGMIRVSGKSAITAVASIFRGKVNLLEAKSHTVHYGKLVDRSGLPIDGVLVTLFRGPHSYTGEDVVEVSCHGGVLNTRIVLQAILHTGVRHAEPGEFTKRAFLNGKLDLAQAEAVAELIAARSESARNAAMRQLEGRFSSRIRALRDELIDLLSLVELELDFSEEGLDLIQKPQLLSKMDSISTALQEMADSYRLGKMYREGVAVAIVGKPNAGKSSLFNALLQQDRAIVTDIPGTTRDSLEESISIDGVLFRLSDTAGLRQSDDTVEQLGIARTLSVIRESDVVLLVVDASNTLAPEEALSFLDGIELPRSGLLVFNKIDLVGGISMEPAEFSYNKCKFQRLFVSAKTGEGLSHLRQSLTDSALGSGPQEHDTFVMNARHQEALLKSVESLASARAAVQSGHSGEFVAEDIRRALRSLAEIIGEVTTDDILNNIFQKFCIGK